MKKKLFTALFIIGIAGVAVARAAFPDTYSSWITGNVITSAWLNAIEQKIGITGTSTSTSLTYGVDHRSGNIGGTGTSSITLTAGTNITISTTTNSITISASGATFTTTTINGASATAYTFATGTSGNGLNIATSAPGTVTFNLPDAANGISGLINSIAQSLAGIKTFLSGIVSNTTSTFNVSNIDQFQIIGSISGANANNLGLLYNTTTTSPGCGAHLSYTNVNTGSTTADGTQMGVNCAGAGIINNLENTPLLFGTGGTFHLQIDQNGNIFSSSTEKWGIGTTTPATALSIVGQETLSSLGTGLVKSTAGLLGNATSGVDYQGVLTFPLVYASTTHATSTWNRNNASGLVFLTTSTDIVGIGTTTPSDTLHIVGTLRVPFSAASGTLTRAGQLLVTTSTSATSTDGGINYFDGVQERKLSPEWGWVVDVSQKGIATNATSVVSTSDVLASFTAKNAFTIDSLDCVNGPVAGNSVAVNILHGTAIDSATALFTTYQNCNSTSTNQTFNSGFSDNTVAAGEIVRIVTTSTAANASSTYFSATMSARNDP